MGKKAVAFRVRSSHVSGFELACSHCPTVLQINHDRRELFPRHRCNGQTRDFEIAFELPFPVPYQTRIDDYRKEAE